MKLKEIELRKFLEILYQQTNDENFLELKDNCPSNFVVITDATSIENLSYYYNGRIFYIDFERALSKAISKAKRPKLYFITSNKVTIY